MNPTPLIIIFLTCLLLSMVEGIPLHKEPRCRCIKNQKKEIPHHKIKKLDIFSANYICKKDEIIATLKKRELKICLSPLEEWVKTLFKMNGTLELKFY
ncbi:interleukin-8b.1 [Electrophorus electricus]|uniref:interleukin-8b.1 n=1 Tax=Electrophorus electricus TaxID=8005 RepID=UPI0015D00769|nr:interleukin-8b.1 [Electrophorus electricus]